MRSLARECVFKFIFSRLFNPNDEGLFTVLINDLSDNDKVFARELLDAVNEGYSLYEEKIASYAKNYRADRILNPDKCAMILGMAEIDKFPATDAPVIIDEAVKIAGKYSTEKSTDFVNGILARYAEEKRNG